MRTLSSIAAVVALTSGSIVSAAQFTVTDLGGFGGTLASRGSGIGSTAMVGGTWYVNGTTPKAATATIDGGGTVTHVQYGLASDSISYGMGIGGLDGETLVGYSLPGSRGTSHAITGDGGVLTDLHSTIAGTAPFTGSDTSRGIAINGSGAVVGQAKNTSGNLQAFTLAGSTVNAVPLIGGYNNSLATAINDGGLAVGFDYNGTWNYAIGGAIAGGLSHGQAFSFNGTVMTALGTLSGGADSIATAVNSAGAIVGQSTVSSADTLDGRGHAFLYSGGSMTALTEAAGTVMSLADDINDSGDIVGTFRTAQFINHAFLYRNGQMIDLNSLISGSGWVLTEATSINEDGYIAGYGTHNGVQTAFLLSPVAGAPVPEPASLGVIGLGAAALVALVARRRRA